MRNKALKTIYDNNVMKFANGEMGAVNGIAADGTLIKTNEQVQEVWTGTTLALAGFMLGEGLKKEAFQTAWGIYHVSYETKGYWFRTPEAWARPAKNAPAKSATAECAVRKRISPAAANRIPPVATVASFKRRRIAAAAPRPPSSPAKKNMGASVNVLLDQAAARSAWTAAQ